MSQDDNRLDLIQPPQFGQTIDRRSAFAETPPGQEVVRGGPVVEPARAVVGDWTVYLARNQAIEVNGAPYSDQIHATISLGTGQSAMQYQEIPEVPSVGIAMHFATAILRTTLRWTNPTGLAAFQSTDMLITWAAPGRPVSQIVKRTQRLYGAAVILPVLNSAFNVANGQRIPSFSTSVTVRMLSVLGLTVPVPFYAVFCTIGGSTLNIFPVDPLGNGANATITIPTRASLLYFVALSSELFRDIQCDFQVIA